MKNSFKLVFFFIPFILFTYYGCTSQEKLTEQPKTERAPVEHHNEPYRAERALVEHHGEDAGSQREVLQEKVSSKKCSFNSDCPTQQRCECTQASGCFCKQGQRGTGKNGIDKCKVGNDCETSLCVEGSDGNYYCSAECKTDADCKTKLPICTTVAYVGRICIRKKQIAP